ncbi:MAG: hypothetical protein EU550_03060, partial [Promethearchaeota archaeon]
MNSKDSEIDKYKARIRELEEELWAKSDRIEQLEDNIMNLEGLLPTDSGEFDKEKVISSKLEMELDEKGREIRSLKNKMGFLRKEKLALQKKLEQQEKVINKDSTVIRVEDIRDSTTPLDALVKELQSKINKQEILIQNLKNTKPEQK